jgi:hypothetical protein
MPRKRKETRSSTIVSITRLLLVLPGLLSAPLFADDNGQAHAGPLHKGEQLAVGQGAMAAAANPYLSELVTRARAAHLAKRAEWLNLLHSKPNLLLPGVHSLADDPGFFNAPDGKTNPEAELEATLAAFFVSREETDTQQPAQCRFIARYRWLKGELSFDPARLAETPCRRYTAWRAALDPQEVTLIFATAYLDNPGSMFGHPLLRVDAKGQNERTRLLAYGISYAADTDETSGLVFAVKGLFGGYPGKFSIMPYYLKVREYSDLENRDIWEYRLNFTPPEIDRMLEHTWELGPTYFDYYFFDENCAYHLLSLFEVARPKLDLTSHFRWWAVPSDTVAAVTSEPGLLEEAVYRPSLATVLHNRLATLTPAQRDLVLDIAARRTTLDDTRLLALEPDARAQTLELAHDYVTYLAIRKHDNSPENAAYRRELLLARSQLPAHEPPSISPPAVRPDQGHASARLDFGVGSQEGDAYVDLRVRPTYHDVLDAEGGYVRGSQIEYFALLLRHYENENFRIEDFKLLDILSVSPRDDFFKALSWKVNVGATRLYLKNGDEPLAAYMNGGAGYSWEMGAANNSLLSVLLESTLEVDNELGSGYALGAGPSVQWLKDLTPNWRLLARTRYQQFGLGDVHSASDLTLSNRLSLGRNMAVRFDLARLVEFERARNDVQLSWLLYF